MTKVRTRRSPPDEIFAARKPARVPFDFVLDELVDLDPVTRPMFGCTSVYVGEKIVLILRERESHEADNGVWLATTADRHAALRPEFPNMRSIGVLGGGETGWQLLPSDAADFEESVLRACELIRKGDARIGKIPAGKKRVAGSAAGKPKASRKAAAPKKKSPRGRP